MPYNTLHDRGFTSIGDEMNTRPVKEGEDHGEGVEPSILVTLNPKPLKGLGFGVGLEVWGYVYIMEKTWKLPHFSCGIRIPEP